MHNYKVLMSETGAGLEIKANQLILDGWIPVGGITCVKASMSESGWRFYQSMYRPAGKF